MIFFINETFKQIERVFDTSLNLGTRMDDLEIAVAEYADQINALDTGLSSQVCNM